jgi:broad specificity phosphatase PhoE
MQIFIIRHGESEGNTIPNQIGQDEMSPLTKKGEMQSRKLQKYFDEKNIAFDYVFSSNYARALSTAQIVCGSYANIQIANDLREYSPGNWRGKPRQTVLTTDVRLNMSASGKRFLPPNGESLSMVERRASNWLDENILYNPSMQNSKIALFSHGMTIRCLLHNIMGFDQSFISKISIENTSVTEMYFSLNDGWKINYINKCSHLE